MVVEYVWILVIDYCVLSDVVVDRLCGLCEEVGKDLRFWVYFYCYGGDGCMIMFFVFYDMLCWSELVDLFFFVEIFVCC